MEKISKLQIVEPKYWSGLTRESHLGWLGMLEPEFISKTVDKLYEVNYGADNFILIPKAHIVGCCKEQTKGTFLS